MNETLTERALVLEYALYKRGIEPVCPLGLIGAADRWHAERQAADLAIDDGVNYFDAAGARDSAQLKDRVAYA